ncbi:peptidase M23 [Marinomonas agarivorans]|nr:peptidase M23 [Marinomonas agarivorans]
MRNVLVLLLLFLSNVLVANELQAAQPQSPEEAERQIKKLQQELQSLNTWLKETQSEKSQVESQLEQKEKSINELIKQIKGLQESLQQNDAQIKKLTLQQRQLNLDMKQQNQQVAAQLRAVYRSGQQEGLKFLLDGRSPEETTRMVLYNRYISQARQSLINGYRLQVDELNLVEKSIRRHRAQQAVEQAELAKETKSLQKEQQARRQILAQLKRDLQTGDRQARRLKQDQQQMAELLNRLREALVKIPEFDGDIAFSSLKGKLKRPLRQLKVAPQTNLGGVLLTASEGESVQAIYHGRVIFSDWLRGFGLVVILDHGEGYMSLYGYNQSLLKEVGEWVNTNDPVATVGTSGGQSKPGLFFSIRHNGSPINPLSWVAKG